MVFARKQTLRTTSNRLEKILYLCCILTSNNILIPISGYNIFYLLRPLHCPHETKFKISNFSDELVLFFALLASYVGILETFYFLFPRFVVNMLVVNILSSSLYLPLVLLTLIINYNDTDQEVSDVNMVQSLLFQAVSHLVGALSVLSTLCTGKTHFFTKYCLFYSDAVTGKPVEIKEWYCSENQYLIDLDRTLTKWLLTCFHIRSGSVSRCLSSPSLSQIHDENQEQLQHWWDCVHCCSSYLHNNYSNHHNPLLLTRLTLRFAR